MPHKQRSERIMQKELLRKSGQTEPRSDVGVRWALYAFTEPADHKRVKHFPKSIAY